MFVVIFRAKIRNLDKEYFDTAMRMRELALNECGCTEFHAVSEGENEVALSYWPSEENIRYWKLHPEHILAQRTGIERWYTSYSVQIAQIHREYSTK